METKIIFIIMEKKINKIFMFGSYYITIFHTRFVVTLSPIS